MTDVEFDILDELYFVQPFQIIHESLSLNELELKEALSGLLKKGWVKCFKTVSEEALPSELDFENDYHTYYYLATKAGLLAHNSK